MAMLLSFRLLEIGGGDAQGHGMVLALQMVKHLKSFQKLTELLIKKGDSSCCGLHCLQHFHRQLTVSICVYHR